MWKDLGWLPGKVCIARSANYTGTSGKEADWRDSDRDAGLHIMTER